MKVLPSQPVMCMADSPSRCRHCRVLLQCAPLVMRWRFHGMLLIWLLCVWRGLSFWPIFCLLAVWYTLFSLAASWFCPLQLSIYDWSNLSPLKMRR